MIVFAHTKFGLVRIQGSGVKRGGRNPAPPQPERVFEIPVLIKLRSLISKAQAGDYVAIANYGSSSIEPDLI